MSNKGKSIWSRLFFASCNKIICLQFYDLAKNNTISNNAESGISIDKLASLIIRLNKIRQNYLTGISDYASGYFRKLMQFKRNSFASRFSCERFITNTIFSIAVEKRRESISVSYNSYIFLFWTVNLSAQVDSGKFLVFAEFPWF